MPKSYDPNEKPSENDYKIPDIAQKKVEPGHELEVIEELKKACIKLIKECYYHKNMSLFYQAILHGYLDPKRDTQQILIGSEVSYISSKRAVEFLLTQGTKKEGWSFDALVEYSKISKKSQIQ